MKLDENFSISLTWDVKDVKAMAKSMGLEQLTMQQSIQILQKLIYDYDYEEGIRNIDIRRAIIRINPSKKIVQIK